MYFLGIDPGIRKLGYSVIDKELNIYDSGILLSENKTSKRDFDRIKDIYEFFEVIVEKYSIKSLGIEKLYFTKYNQANAEFVYGVRGALIMLCKKKSINIFEYTPKELKKNVTGNGQAGKQLVQQFVCKIFSLEYTPKYNDAADALGLAYLVSKKNV